MLLLQNFSMFAKLLQDMIPGFVLGKLASLLVCFLGNTCLISCTVNIIIPLPLCLFALVWCKDGIGKDKRTNSNSYFYSLRRKEKQNIKFDLVLSGLC